MEYAINSTTTKPLNNIMIARPNKRVGLAITNDEDVVLFNKAPKDQKDPTTVIKVPFHKFNVRKAYGEGNTRYFEVIPLENNFQELEDVVVDKAKEEKTETTKLNKASNALGTRRAMREKAGINTQDPGVMDVLTICGRGIINNGWNIAFVVYGIAVTVTCIFLIFKVLNSSSDNPTDCQINNQLDSFEKDISHDSESQTRDTIWSFIKGMYDVFLAGYNNPPSKANQIAAANYQRGWENCAIYFNNTVLNGTIPKTT